MARLPNLAHQDWLRDERLQVLLRTLNTSGEARVAGGAVRNALLGVPVADVDVATTHLPETVMTLCKAAGFGIHPTGLDHGTVTVSRSGAAFEVTTLRKDVATDGRRAVVAFTQDWTEDAARRDFTMNALYCSADGEVFDFTDGYADIRKRSVKFVGAPSTRIREDFLRILRFFRFHAAYGKGAPDTAGLKACVRLRAGLKKLSAERIRQEMFKLLVAPRAVETLTLMAENSILKIILPHTDEWRLLKRLPPDPVLRLFALSRQPDTLKDHFRLSNADSNRIAALRTAPLLSPALLAAEQHRLLYLTGADAWRDAVHLSWAASRASLQNPGWQALLALPENWTLPTFPLKGVDLLESGFTPGPHIGSTLSALEDWWLACDFTPTKNDLLARASRYKPEREKP